jgi:hypothetical protein
MEDSRESLSGEPPADCRPELSGIRFASVWMTPNIHAIPYLRTKKERMGNTLTLV